MNDNGFISANAAPSVFRLGYVDLAITAMEGQLRYYTDVIGAQINETGEDGTRFLSLGLNHHDVSLSPSPSGGVRAVGLQLVPSIDLGSLAKVLRAHGISADVQSDSRPGVSELIEIADIGGHRLQLFKTISAPAPGFAHRGIVPNKLGHVALLSPEPDILVTFFRDILGFTITDWIGDIATFLTCNHEHHVVNIGGAPVARMHHIAYELRDTAYHAVACDILMRERIPIQWGPSRHTAGHNVASYHYDPGHTLVELYSEMDVYLRHVGICEPRPWHRDLPQRPRHWGLDELTIWETRYEFDLTKA